MDNFCSPCAANFGDWAIDVNDADAVKYVQELLNKAGYYVTLSGIVDERTVAAVRSLQAKSSLAVTGEIDDATLNALASAGGTPVRGGGEIVMDPLLITGKLSGGAMLALAFGAWLLWKRKKKSNT